MLGEGGGCYYGGMLPGIVFKNGTIWCILVKFQGENSLKISVLIHSNNYENNYEFVRKGRGYASRENFEKIVQFGAF